MTELWPKLVTTRQLSAMVAFFVIQATIFRAQHGISANFICNRSDDTDWIFKHNTLRVGSMHFFSTRNNDCRSVTILFHVVNCFPEKGDHWVTHTLGTTAFLHRCYFGIDFYPYSWLLLRHYRHISHFEPHLQAYIARCSFSNTVWICFLDQLLPPHL